MGNKVILTTIDIDQAVEEILDIIFDELEIDTNIADSKYLNKRGIMYERIKSYLEDY